MQQALFTLMLLLLLVTPSWAQIENLTVRVDGLTCPFCAFGLEKRLSKLDEVDAVSLDQPNGLAVLTMKTGQVVDFHDMRDAIIGSGFTPREINVTATGRVENWNGRLTLVVHESERFFLKDDGQLLKTVVDTPELVTVTGVAALSPEDNDEHQHPYMITVRTIGVAQ